MQFEKEFWKSQKLIARAQARQKANVKGNPVMTSKLALQTFISALDSLAGYVMNVDCPPAEKASIAAKALDLKAELQKLAEIPKI